MKDLWLALSYKTTNIGDDIQTLAATRYLPTVDRYIDRDRIARGLGDGARGRCILNGWYTWGDTWPPAEDVVPLATSFHIASRPEIIELMTGEKSVDWMRRNGPIGCRSYSTLDLLQSLDVDSYFSGCLTLTLERPPVEDNHMTVWVDAKMPQWGRWKPEAQFGILENSIFVSHDCNPNTPAEMRLDIARRLLELYAGARLVVTNRLHAALPCIAFGTPVLFILPDYEPDRVSPYLGLMSGVVNASDFRSGNFDFNWDEPPPVDRPQEIIRDLEEKVRSWVLRV